MSISPATPQSIRPTPPRFVWLRRSLALLALWLVGLIGLRFAVGAYAERRWNQTLAEYRARGTPILPADFVHTPRGVNGFDVLIEALDALPPPPPAGTLTIDELVSDAVLLDEYPEFWSAELPKYGRSVERVNAARQLDRGSANERAWLKSAFDRRLGQCRILYRAVLATAVADSKAGRWESAAARLSDAVWLIDPIMESGSAINALVGYSYAGLLRAAVQQIIWAFPADANVEMSPEARDRFLALIDQLRDRDALRSRHASVFDGLRAALLHDVTLLIDGRPPLSGFTDMYPQPWLSPSHNAILFAPRWRLHALRAAPKFDIARTAHSAAAYRRIVAQDLLAGNLYDSDWLHRRTLAQELSWVLSPANMFGTEGIVRNSLTAQASLEEAAAALAVWLFTVDHGRRPTWWHECVPAYLPEIPLDRLSDDLRAIEYGPDYCATIGSNSEPDRETPFRLRLRPSPRLSLDVDRRVWWYAFTNPRPVDSTPRASNAPPIPPLNEPPPASNPTPPGSP